MKIPKEENKINFENIKNIDTQYIANTYKRGEIAILNGNSSTAYDIDGKDYIDFSSGIGVNSLGFSSDLWTDAIKKQINLLNHASNLFYTLPGGVLAKKLCEITGMKKVFFSNSGAEANECAIKTARKYSFDKYGSDRYEIITLENSFHGRTMATLSATGQDVFHKNFNPFLDGFKYAKANDINDLESLVSEKTAAIMVECIQGEGGVLPLNTEFLKKIKHICDEKDILLIVDEVQTGVGRTGSFLAIESYGIVPDIVTLAKGLGGGLPIGATLFSAKTENVLSAGDHGTTFGGNPIVCAGAIAVIEAVDDDMLADVRKKGSIITNFLANLEAVESVTGSGLMIGAKLKPKYNPSKIVEIGLLNGVIILTAKDKIRFLPPLNISDSEIAEGLRRIKKVFELYDDMEATQ